MPVDDFKDAATLLIRPWGNLAIFHKDLGYVNGLVKLGTVGSGIEELAAMSSDCSITIEPAS